MKDTYQPIGSQWKLKANQMPPSLERFLCFLVKINCAAHVPTSIELRLIYYNSTNDNHFMSLFVGQGLFFRDIHPFQWIYEMFVHEQTLLVEKACEAELWIATLF